MSDLHDHRLISAHRCICGWEGDSAVTHVLDSLLAMPEQDRSALLGLRKHCDVVLSGRFIPVYMWTLEGCKGEEA